MAAAKIKPTPRKKGSSKPKKLSVSTSKAVSAVTSTATDVAAPAATSEAAPAAKLAMPVVETAKSPHTAKLSLDKVKAAAASSKAAILEHHGAASKKAAVETGKQRRERYQRAQAVKMVLRGSIVLVVVALTIVAGYLILKNSSAFSITTIEAEPTDHVSSTDIQNLVQVPEGSTLLNVDTAAIEEALKQNPWVASVSFDRVFPDTLRITITDQVPDAIVIMGASHVAWYLSREGSWIEPVSIIAEEDESVSDAALRRAAAEGVLLVTDVSDTVEPLAGAKSADEEILAVEQFREGFSDDFNAQIVSFSAPSADGITCTLKSGVEVLLGTATNIPTKEAIVTSYLEQYPDSAIYINVRSVTNATVKIVDSENVQAGSGVVVGDEYY